MVDYTFKLKINLGISYERGFLSLWKYVYLLPLNLNEQFPSIGQGEFDVSCGNRPVSPNNSVSDKTPKHHDERLPDKLY